MDCRDIAANKRNWYIYLDEQRMLATVEIYEEEIEVSFKWEVCSTCDGKGSHVNPSIDSQGISQEEFDDDPDFEEGYFSGRYDVICYECEGKRVVPVTEDKRVLEHIRDQHILDLEIEHERRMGY